MKQYKKICFLRYNRCNIVIYILLLHILISFSLTAQQKNEKIVEKEKEKEKPAFSTQNSNAKTTSPSQNNISESSENAPESISQNGYNLENSAMYFIRTINIQGLRTTASVKYLIFFLPFYQGMLISEENINKKIDYALSLLKEDNTFLVNSIQYQIISPTEIAISIDITLNAFPVEISGDLNYGSVFFRGIGPGNRIGLNLGPNKQEMTLELASITPFGISGTIGHSILQNQGIRNNVSRTGGSVQLYVAPKPEVSIGLMINPYLYAFFDTPSGVSPQDRTLFDIEIGIFGSLNFLHLLNISPIGFKAYASYLLLPLATFNQTFKILFDLDFRVNFTSFLQWRFQTALKYISSNEVPLLPESGIPNALDRGQVVFSVHTNLLLYFLTLNITEPNIDFTFGIQPLFYLAQAGDAFNFQNIQLAAGAGPILHISAPLNLMISPQFFFTYSYTTEFGFGFELQLETNF